MKNIFLLCLCMLSPIVNAGGVVDATVTSIMPSGQSANAVFFVYLDKNNTNPAACVDIIKYPNRFVVNTSHTAGQATIASILIAFSKQKKVTIYGSKNCTDWSNTESIDWIHING